MVSFSFGESPNRTSLVNNIGVEELTERTRTAPVFASTALSELLSTVERRGVGCPASAVTRCGRRNGCRHGGVQGRHCNDKRGADSASSVTVGVHSIFPPSITLVVVTTLLPLNPSL